MKPQKLIRPFYRRFLLEVLIRAVFAGVCITMGLICAWILVFRVFLDRPQEHLILWAVPVFLLSSLVLGMRGRPSMMDAAKRIDRELGLESRTATALAFADDPALFARLQRQDAMQRLAAASPKGIPMQISWPIPLASLLLTLAAVGLSFLPCHVLVRDEPALSDPARAGNGSFESTIARLDQESTKQADVEQENVAAMESFLAEISELMEENQVDSTETTTDQVKSITGLTTDISGAMSAYAQFLAALLSQEHWNAVGTALLTGDASVIHDSFDAMCDQLVALPMPEESQEVSACSSELKTAFAGMDQEAKEIKVSATLQDAMYTLEWIGGYYTDDKNACDQQVRTLFETLGNTFFDYYAASEEGSLKKQGAPQERMENAHVEVRSLTRIFRDSSKEGTGTVEQGSGAWGIREEGTMGNSEYSETILTFDPYLSDPNLGVYVPYGQVYGIYYSEMSEEKANGRIPEDIAEAVDNYFGAL